jgi:NAD(P)-dependent dehydrogenase (short-subunit alcohol dehydrogenase family)
MSKTALNMVTAMYAKELFDTPIKVNAANPGRLVAQSRPVAQIAKAWETFHWPPAGTSVRTTRF